MKKPQGKSAVGAKEGSGLDLSIVAALAKIAGQHDLSEVEIEHQGLRVRVARERAAAPLATFVAPPMVAAPAAPPGQEPIAAAATGATPPDHPGLVKSPMVGTAYRRASPEAKPFVEIGSL